jgi:hypothetical protein
VKYRYLIVDAATYRILGTNDLSAIHKDWINDQGCYVIDTETQEGVGHEGVRFPVEPLN